MVQQILSTNTFCEAKFVVSATASNGTHTTIQAAINAASSGDTIFIRPGSYSENLTLAAGVNLVAYIGDQSTPNVTIIGKATATFDGTCTISGIRLQTNSDFLLAVTGSSATVVKLSNCDLQGANNTMINFTSSSAISSITLINCTGNLQTTGISYFSHSSSGNLIFNTCSIGNTGGSSTASTCSAGTISLYWSNLTGPITTSSTGGLFAFQSIVQSNSTNTTALTIGGSGSNNIYFCRVLGGTASAISIGSSNCLLTNTSVQSTNSFAITGSGTLTYNAITFEDTGHIINTTTQSCLNAGTWTPTIDGSVSGTTTYTTQTGYYIINNGMVTLWWQIVITAATGTGNAIIGGLPFTSRNVSNLTYMGTCTLSGSWSWGASQTQLLPKLGANASTMSLSATHSNGAETLLQMTNAAMYTFGSITYPI